MRWKVLKQRTTEAGQHGPYTYAYRRYQRVKTSIKQPSFL